MIFAGIYMGQRFRQNRACKVSKERKALIVLSLALLVLGRPAFGEQAKKFKPGFHLKVAGGVFNAAIGDMNTHLRSMNEYLRAYYQEEASGETKALSRWANEWQLEALWDISPKFRWGLAVVPFTRFKNESTFFGADVREYRIDHEISFKPEIKLTVPAMLSVYYSVYSSSRLNFFVHTGIGLYLATMKEEYNRNYIYPRGDVYYNRRFWSVESKANFGFHGGISLEYGLGRNMAFVCELQGRYVRVKDLRGQVEYTTNFGSGRPIGEGGVLHFFGSSASYFDLDIPLPFHLGIPNEDDEYVERKAILNLNGFSLRFGLRVRIF